MKRLILLILTILPSIVMAYDDGFTDLVDRYSSEKGFTTIRLSKDMLQSMGVSNGINQMEVIALEDTKHIERFQADVKSITDGLKVVMSVNSGDEIVKIFSKSGDSGAIYEMVIFTSDGNEAVLIRLLGDNIQLKEATQMINF